MRNHNILVIPHTPHIHVKVRSYEIAKTLASENNVYYLLWDEVNDFSLLGRLKQHAKSFMSLGGSNSLMNNWHIQKHDNITLLVDVPRAYAPAWYADMHNAMQLDEIVNENKIDIVINASLISSPITTRKSLTYIYDLVDDPLHSGNASTDKMRSRFIDKEIIKADIVTACSITLGENAAEIWGREVMFLPNGTDIASFRNIADDVIEKKKQQLGIEGKKCIGFISNFEPWNGLSFLADVFEKLLAIRKDIVLLLVGSGKGLDQVAERFKRMDNVVMTGAVSPEDVSDYFRMIDLGLLPFDECSLTDMAFPIKIIEYSVGRKHVVATPLAELKRQEFPNVHLVEKDIDLWVEEISRKLELKWQNSWDSLYAQYDWTRIVDDVLIPEIEKHQAARMSETDESPPCISRA